MQYVHCYVNIDRRYGKLLKQEFVYFKRQSVIICCVLCIAWPASTPAKKKNIENLVPEKNKQSTHS